MRLFYPTPPPKIRDLAYKALNMELLRHPQADSTAEPVGRANAAGHVPDLLSIFLLQASEVAKRKTLRGAKPIGWYDVMVFSGISHGIEVSQPTRGDGAVYVTRGADVDDQLAILTELAADTVPGQAEVRILRIPWIATFSFWLHGRRGDRLIPVSTTTPQLQKGKKYSPAEFFKAIREAAIHLAKNTEAIGTPSSKAAKVPANARTPRKNARARKRPTH